MKPETRDPVGYEPPAVRVLGSVRELTQGCNKDFGGSDGYTFGASQTPIVCTSA